MLAGSLYAVPAGATTTGTNSTIARPVAATGGFRCGMTISSVTAGGDLGGAAVFATRPPTRTPLPSTGGLATPPHLFPAGSAKLSTTWEHSIDTGGDFRDFGNVVLGSTLNNVTFFFDGIGGRTTTAVVGGGWGDYKAIASPKYANLHSPSRRNYFYGLRNDGVLFRWAPRLVGSKISYERFGSYSGFSAVKAMTLISQTATYDTFLANLRGGSLYTIRIPVTSPMTAVVKQVRSRSWQVFEFLIAEGCGTQSTLLTGIDKDTGFAYLYAVGHATGATTAILSLGKIPGVLPDPVYFLRHPELNNLNGE